MGKQGARKFSNGPLVNHTQAFNGICGSLLRGCAALFELFTSSVLCVCREGPELFIAIVLHLIFSLIFNVFDLLLNLFFGFTSDFHSALAGGVDLVDEVKGLRHLKHEDETFAGEVVGKRGPIQAGHALKLVVDV